MLQEGGCCLLFLLPLLLSTVWQGIFSKPTPTGPLIGVALLLPPLSPQDKAALESRCTQLESELRKSKRREEKLQVGAGVAVEAGSCGLHADIGRAFQQGNDPNLSKRLRHARLLLLCF